MGEFLGKKKEKGSLGGGWDIRGVDRGKLSGNILNIAMGLKNGMKSE